MKSEKINGNNMRFYNETLMIQTSQHTFYVAYNQDQHCLTPFNSSLSATAVNHAYPDQKVRLKRGSWSGSAL